VTGDRGVGGLIGFNHGGEVENSDATGNVSGNEDVGQLIGKEESIPGFTTMLLLLASIIAIAIYRKKSTKS